MLLPKTNIQEKLHRAKLRDSTTQECRLQEVYAILKDVDIEIERIEQNIAHRNETPVNHFNIDLLETSRIYHINEIKDICIDYRLRFLDSKYFKGKIPSEAISKIKAMEREHNLEMKGFKIIAPSKLFKLEDKDDPLLFAPIGNEYHYLIHQWGNDLHPLRKLMMWPFKNIVNLSILVFLVSYLVTLMVPEGLFSKSNSSAEFWII